MRGDRADLLTLTVQEYFDTTLATSRSSIWREGDDQSSVVMDEPSSLDALIPRDEIDAGPAPRVALMTPQRLRFFAAQISVGFLRFREVVV